MPTLSGIFTHSFAGQQIHFPVLNEQNLNAEDKANQLLQEENFCIRNSQGSTLRVGDIILSYVGQPHLADINGENKLLNQDNCQSVFSALRSEGIEAFKRLKGHFALSLIDLENSQCYLFSDRIGAYRLYWHQTTQGDLVYSTSMRDVKNIARLENDINQGCGVLLYVFPYGPHPF